MADEMNNAFKIKCYTYYLLKSKVIVSLPNDFAYHLELFHIQLTYSCHLEVWLVFCFVCVFYCISVWFVSAGDFFSVGISSRSSDRHIRLPVSYFDRQTRPRSTLSVSPRNVVPFFVKRAKPLNQRSDLVCTRFFGIHQLRIALSNCETNSKARDYLWRMRVAQLENWFRRLFMTRTSCRYVPDITFVERRWS